MAMNSVRPSRIGHGGKKTGAVTAATATARPIAQPTLRPLRAAKKPGQKLGGAALEACGFEGMAPTIARSCAAANVSSCAVR